MISHHHHLIVCQCTVQTPVHSKTFKDKELRLNASQLNLMGNLHVQAVAFPANMFESSILGCQGGASIGIELQFWMLRAHTHTQSRIWKELSHDLWVSSVKTATQSWLRLCRRVLASCRGHFPSVCHSQVVETQRCTEPAEFTHHWSRVESSLPKLAEFHPGTHPHRIVG